MLAGKGEDDAQQGANLLRISAVVAIGQTVERRQDLQRRSGQRKPGVMGGARRAHRARTAGMVEAQDTQEFTTIDHAEEAARLTPQRAVVGSAGEVDDAAGSAIAALRPAGAGQVVLLAAGEDDGGARKRQTHDVGVFPAVGQPTWTGEDRGIQVCRLQRAIQPRQDVGQAEGRRQRWDRCHDRHITIIPSDAKRPWKVLEYQHDYGMQLNLSGLISAPFTPFTADNQTDLPGIDRLCAHLVRQGVSGAFVCGTTGEGVAMTVAERMQVAERWLACAPAGFPVIVHAGALALGDARALAAHAERHRAAAVAVLPPCFLKPGSVAEVVDWIAAVASACPTTPVTYYHIPSLTGVVLPVHDIVDLALQRVPNFAGIKFTFEDLHDYGRCVAAYGDRLSIAFGRDEMLLPAIAIGAKAAVGSTYNIAAPLYLRIIDAFTRGDLASARASQQQACAMIEVLKRHRALPAMKALLAMQGVPCGACRLPLRTLDASEMAALRRDLEALPIANDLFSTWSAS